MKYMGSKSRLLRNGLSDILLAEATKAHRVVDLFCGAASVSWFAATNIHKPVYAYDLQKYAVILASAVVKRSKSLTDSQLDDLWLDRVEPSRSRFKGWKLAHDLDSSNINIETWQQQARELCASNIAAKSSLIWRCYGGYYFSPTQSLTLDAMLRSIPEQDELRDICLAAVIIAASQCAASPGHTAQPFKATGATAKHLSELWSRDPILYAKKAVTKLISLKALSPGNAALGDANIVAAQLRSSDLVFVDPPYSGVQYSRFYHVLETIARGNCAKVEGEGRYPPSSERPNSTYSRKSSALESITNLLQSLASKKCTVILTFPKKECSNGLSGDRIEELAKEYFHVNNKCIESRFSTLGGNDKIRSSRMTLDELVLVLRSS